MSGTTGTSWPLCLHTPWPLDRARIIDRSNRSESLWKEGGGVWWEYFSVQVQEGGHGLAIGSHGLSCQGHLSVEKELLRRSRTKSGMDVLGGTGKCRLANQSGTCTFHRDQGDTRLNNGSQSGA